MSTPDSIQPDSIDYQSPENTDSFTQLANVEQKSAENPKSPIQDNNANDATQDSTPVKTNPTINANSQNQSSDVIMTPTNDTNSNMDPQETPPTQLVQNSNNTNSPPTTTSNAPEKSKEVSEFISSGLASFHSALTTLSSNSLVEVMEALETLLVYTKNLILFPDEKKYRKIKISNIHYQERLGHLSGAVECMKCIGYVPVGDYLRLDEKRMSTPGNTELLKELENCVQTKLTNVKREWSLLPQRLDHSHTFSSVDSAGSYSAIGKRHSMEDDEIICDRFCDQPEQGYFGLYDGHGGRATVDFVVKALHLNLENYMRRNQQKDLQFQQDSANFSPNSTTPTPSTSFLAEAFKQSYLATDGQLRRQNILRSGTTSVTCVVRVVNGQKMLFTANVGDSRAILCRGKTAIRLTKDHKSSDPSESKRIVERGGFIGRNKRVNGVLAISRALGDHMLKENDVVSAEPYCTDTVLTPEDTHILLACDGVWDVMTDQEAIDFMLQKIAYYEQKHKEYLEKIKEGVDPNTSEQNANSSVSRVSDSQSTSTNNSDLYNPNEPQQQQSSQPNSSAILDSTTSNGPISPIDHNHRQPDGTATHANKDIGEYPRNSNEIMYLVAKALVKEALDKRSLDNVTVMCIKL